MAVVGFEVDQVIRTPNGDESVPINAAYNHHFDGQINGEKSVFEKLGANDPRLADLRAEMGHRAGAENIWVARELEPSITGVPTVLRVGGGNGGEYRRTFHGYPPTFVQAVESPTSMQITPMQIDTFNRDKMNLTGPHTRFVPGPVSRNSLAPTEGQDATYSGLLECPMTTRLTKDIDSSYNIIASGTCADAIHTANECFVAAAKVLGSAANGAALLRRIVDDTSLPSGCSALAGPGSNNVTVVFNTAPATTEGVSSQGLCGVNAEARVGRAESLVHLQVSLDTVSEQATISITGPADVWFGVGFNASAMRDRPWAIIVDGNGKVSERKLENQGAGGGGELLSPSVTIQSSHVDGSGNRTVVLTRAMKGTDADHFTFEAGANPTLPFINAVGTGVDLSYHRAKTISTIVLLPVDRTEATTASASTLGSAPALSVGGACVCATKPLPFGQGKGSFRYTPVDQPGESGKPTTVRFNNMCAGQYSEGHTGSLLSQHNPTCDVRWYTGGQIGCHHMFALLDADQQIPWADQPLTYHLKFRFWYQDYNTSFHRQVKYSSLGKGTDWSIGAGPMAPGYGAEFDVPKCGHGVMGCSLDEPEPEWKGKWVHTIEGTFKIAGAQGVSAPVVAHLHCHAPTCLAMRVYNNVTGELLCEERSVYGQGRRNVSMDEPGFIAVPPCVWGRESDGLAPPPNLTGIALRVVKKSNATYGHHGEMAHGEIYYIDDLAEAQVRRER
jgi:hypothetical protein